MKKLLMMTSLLMMGSSFASVVKSNDYQNGCSLFRILKNKDSKMNSNESLVHNKATYGFKLIGKSVDFEEKLVNVEIQQQLVMRFNVPLIKTRKNYTINKNNPNFSKLFERINYDLLTFQQICITPEFEIIHASDDL